MGLVFRDVKRQSPSVKIEPEKWLGHLRRAAVPGGPLNRKIRICATEAAVLSIGIHLLLIFCAGSMVIWRVTREKEAAFKSENIERPKPEEDRAAQLPVKIDEFQRSGAKSRMAGRIVTAVERPFALPATGLPEMKFEAAGSVADSLSLSSHSLPGGLDLGVTGVNFFGTRSSGEKMVFILDASKQMMEDGKGGYYTYKFAKDKIHELVDAMPAATLFNVMVYNDTKVDMFRPQPVPATQANRDALKAWLAPINSDPRNVGQVSGKYRSAFEYPSEIGGGVRHWLQAVQAAMEQTADNIFVLCGGFGRYPVRQSGPAPVRDESKMAEYRARLKAVNEKATAAFNAENAARAAKGLPPKIVYNWNDYMTKELRIAMPEPPAVTSGGGGGRTIEPEKLVQDHLDAVWAAQYTPKELMPPRIHFVYLIAGNASMRDGYLDVTALRSTADAFRGDFELLRGAKTMKNLLQYNSSLQ
jgi:hypothetical protein